MSKMEVNHEEVPCKNEQSKRSKFIEKGGQLDQKSRRKLIQKALI